MELKFTDGSSLELPSTEAAAARYLADVMSHGGRLPDKDVKLDWETFAETISPKNQDLTKTSEILPLLSKTMEILIREPVEPTMVITNLYNKIVAKGLDTRVLAGAMGAVYAQDVQELGTYPEVMFQVGGAMSTATISKSGIAASFSDEALRYSTWDIMAINLRLMGAALVRHKEQKAVSFLRNLGTSLFDNLTPAESLYGVMTGRGIAGTANGTMNMDNLMRGMAHMAEEGFPAGTLLMHPLFYYAFLLDPVLRTMMLAHGGGSWYNMYSGDPGPRAPWGNGAMGAMGPSTGQVITNPGATHGNTVTPVENRSNRADSVPNVPSYFPFNFRVLVSPLVPFDPEDETGDVYLLSDGNVGFYLEDEAPTTVEWRDEGVESVKVKIRERYTFAIAHEGQGVGVFKNVKVAQNYFAGVVSPTVTNLAEIDPDTSPL